MKRLRKIVYLTGSRAEFGLMQPILNKLNKKCNLGLIVTGSHLSKKHGYSIDEIRKEKYHILNVIKTSEESNEPVEMVHNISILLPKIAQILTKFKPDLVLVEGDRFEQLSMAICASTMNIPVVHTSGGLVSKSIDDLYRNAITKLSHIHLVPSKKSAMRIIKMNEESWRVKNVGAIINYNVKNIDVYNKLNLKKTKPIILVIQHSVTTEYDNAGKQMRETLKAIKSLGYQTIIIYPNSDPGSKEIIKEIEKCRTLSFIKIFKNIENEIFMNLLKTIDVVVGNSSAAIHEAPFFKLPAVLVGNRQKNREHGDNVIHVDYNSKKIIGGINKSLNKNFYQNIHVNPFKAKHSTETRIVEILLKLKINSKLLSKEPVF